MSILNTVMLDFYLQLRWAAMHSVLCRYKTLENEISNWSKGCFTI